MTFALAAAGTGGHVYPALAVADALVARGVPTSDVVFFGGSRMEATTVPAAGYPFVEVEIRGLRRSMSTANLALPAVVWRATRRIQEELSARAVGVAGVFGGYVSVPAAWAARRSGVPLFVQEQNAVPGLANRLVARWAEASFVGFPDAAERLPRARVVGNPLRSAFARFDRAALRGQARARYGLPADATVLGILGGSLGAAVLNDAASSIASLLDARRDVALLHLTGRSHVETVQRRSEGSPVSWLAVGFEDEMEHFYAASDLVVSRAGALTIAELAATGTPAVVVPYAAGTAGHQAANAAALASAGGAQIVAESDIETLPNLVVRLLDDESARSAMALAAAGEGRPDAADVVAGALIEAHGV